MAAQSSEDNQIRSIKAFEDAIQYVESVKSTFGEISKEYLHFLTVLNDSSAKRTPFLEGWLFNFLHIFTLRVTSWRIKLLFFGHQELIEGFNNFLPEGSKITLSLNRRPDMDVQKTIDYITNVKIAFSKEEQRYGSILQLITGYQDAGMSLQELGEEMCKLLSDRQDLLEEFFDYMP